MYWQKQFDRENPNQQLEDEIKGIRVKHPNYGYRRIQASLTKQGYTHNIKKNIDYVNYYNYKYAHLLGRVESFLPIKAKLEK